jgi:hypothetical protein
MGLASHCRVEELIRLGDAAVPALLEALENDERLTRSVHFWRDSSPRKRPIRRSLACPWELAFRG